MQKQKYYEALFRSVPCGILQLELPLQEMCRVHRMNPKAADILRISQTEWDKTQVLWLSAYMDEDNQKYARMIFEKIKKMGDCEPFLLRLHQGTIEGEAQFVESAEGVPVVQCMFREIGGEIEIRRREAEQKELMESVLQSVRCGVVRFGFEGDEQRITVVNWAGWQMLGFESEEQCKEQGMNGFLPRVHPDDRSIFLKNHCTLGANNEKKECEFRIARREGGYYWLTAVEQAIRDTHGNHIVQMTLADISAQKRLMQEKDQENNEIIRSLGMIYSSVFYIDVKNDSYRVVKGMDEVSNTHLTHCYSKDLIIPARLLVHDEEHSAMMQALTMDSFRQLYRENVDSWEQDFFMKMPGNDTPLYFRAEALLAGENGELTHITMGVRDVTKLRAKQRQERDALRSAYEAAKQASRAKTDFLSHMSHDIRTPMNAIVGLTEIMSTHRDDREKMDDCLNKIRDSSQLLLGLINDVLDMSRIESGKIVLNEQPFYMRDLVEHIGTVLQANIQQHHHTYKTDFALPEHPLLGDALRIQQILMNLLSNSIKFTPDGGVIELRVWTTAATNPKYQNVHFSVTDNGMGMPQSFIGHIFEPFERAQNAGASHIQGSGLGMTIVNNLIQLMNGLIEISSECGKGSSFQIMLPMKIANTEETETNQQKRPHDPKKIRLDGRRILIVEDNRINMEIACALVGETGAIVERAENGQQAVQKMEQAPLYFYDLILMDIQMPVMNGYEATRAIRGLPRADAGTVPILAMTANAFAEDIYAAQQAGMNEHLSKPIQLPLLYDALRRWLET